MKSKTILIGLILLGAQGTLALDDVAKAPREASPDCGTSALSDLLQLEGRPVSLAGLTSRLPTRRPDGFSFAELRQAASSCGLALDGVLLNKDDAAIDRPMILFVKRPPHDHYLVVRPVGHTGKLVQIIDMAEEPIVVDKSLLINSSIWTGLALVPRRTRIGPWLAGVSLVTSLGAAALLFAKSRKARVASVS